MKDWLKIWKATTSRLVAATMISSYTAGKGCVYVCQWVTVFVGGGGWVGG